MSQIAELAWYTEDRNLDLVRVLKKLPEVLGIERLSIVTRISPYVSTFLQAKRATSNWVCKEMLSSELHCLATRDSTLLARCYHTEDSKVALQVLKTIEKEVPRSALGECSFHELSFFVGQYIIWDNVKELVVAAPAVAIRFQSSRTPSHAARTEKILASSKKLASIRAKVEKVTGPLQQVVAYQV